MEKIKVIRLTLEDAKKIPNMLGRICYAMLREHGIYTCKIEGKKIKFILSN